jgi:drug/metabolite transporter (DMT)-like permease
VSEQQEEPPSPSSPSSPTLSSARRGPPLLQALAFAAVYLIWGSTYLGIRVAVRTMPPFLMAGARYLLAGVVLFLLLRAARVAAPTLGQWVRSGAAGVVMLAVGNGLVTWAEQEVPSNYAALLISAVPLHVALIEWLRPRGVRPAASQLAGIAVGAAGMALLVWPASHSAGAPSAIGIAAVLVSGLAWAAGSLYARYSPHHPNAVMAAAQQMIVGAVALFAIGFVRGEAHGAALAAISASSVVAFLYLSIFGSLVAFSTFGWLLTVSTPARLSTTAFVNPVVAVLLGWLLLGESLSTRAQAGAALIVCAVVVMTVGVRPLLLPLLLWRALRTRVSAL